MPGVLVGGGAVAGPVVGDQVSDDLAKAEMLAFPLLFLLTLVVFRGAIAALLPLFVGLLTIMTTFLGLRLFNEATSLSIFALNLAIGLGLGLAIDYSLFVLSRYREEMERDGPGRAALTRTLRTAGRTVIFSSLTVAAAMLSLLVFPQRFLYSMAISGSLTALAAGLISLIALPALLMVLGPRVDALAPKRWRHRDVATQRGFWYRLSHGVMRRPLLVADHDVGGPDRRRASRSRGSSSPASTPACCPTARSAKQVDTALRTEFPPGRASPLHVAVDAPRDRARGAARLRRGACARATTSPPSTRRASSATTRGSSTVAPAGGALDRQALDLVRAVRAGPAPGDGARGRRVGALRRPARRARPTACRWRSPCWRSRRC